MVYVVHSPTFACSSLRDGESVCIWWCQSSVISVEKDIISYIFHTLFPGFSVELLMFGVASLDDFSGSC